MNSKKKRRGQMSEAFCTAMFLSLSGGLQDVYTYLFRGKVFANAQTGNIVLMAVHAFAGESGRVLRVRGRADAPEAAESAAAPLAAAGGAM